MSVVSSIVVFSIIKILVSSWTKTDAYKLGLIDEKGKRTDKKAETKAEKESINSFYRFVFNIKRMLEKMPGGKLSTYAATAFLLLKEEYNLTDSDIKMIKEEVTNAVASTGVESNAENLGPAEVIRRKVEPDDMFSGYAVFDVDNSTYYKNLRPKEKYKRWIKTLAIDEDMSDFGENHRIYEYSKQNPKTGIILRKEGTGIMRVIREK